MFKGALQEVITKALSAAAARGAEHCTVEDLLLGLLTHEGSPRLLRGDAKVGARLRLNLEAHLRSEQRGPVPMAAADQNLERVLARALVLGRLLGRIPGLPEVLGVIQTEPDSYAARLLQEEGLSYVDIFEDILEDSKPAAAFAVRYSSTKPLIGREPEIERILCILASRTRNCAMLVGERGVGKTALLKHLARLLDKSPALVSGDPPFVRVLKVDWVVQGVDSRIELERRYATIQRELTRQGRFVLLIDDFSTILTAEAFFGLTGSSTLLRMVLGSTRRNHCLAVMPARDHLAAIDRDPQSFSRFEVVPLGELSVPDTVAALRAQRNRLQKRHGVGLSEAALVRATDLSRGQTAQRRLPGGAFDLVERAAALVKMRTSQGSRTRTVVDARDVKDAVELSAPSSQTRPDRRERARLMNLEQQLNGKVFGQQAAIASLVQAVRIHRAGLGAAGKPIGSFLFAGPSGVGKTELARQLADALSLPLVRFDMSEYMERHSVSRLIGAPPGYVGYDRGGLLTDAVNATPHAILLLDEIEKAHSDVCNVLLQVMDHGKLTDSRGRVTDFRQTVLIMTSNVGASDASVRRPGFVRDDSTVDSGKALRSVFSVEFRDRLTAKIDFGRLLPEHMRLILDRQLADLSAQLATRRVRISVTENGRTYLLDKGFDASQGARPLARLLQSAVVRRLGDEVLFGGLTKGGTVVVDAAEGELLLKVQPRTKA
jgi:ATP-dependent Clp protease ATP-binding subunit ClpA